MGLEKVYKAGKTTALKRGLMKRGLIYLFVILMLFTLVVAVDTNLNDPCSTTDDCVYLCKNFLKLNSDCYCSQGFCFLRSASNSSSNNTANSANRNSANNSAAASYATVTELNTLKTEVSTVKQSVVSIQSSLQSVESDLNTLNTQLLTVQQSLQQATESISLQQEDLNNLREELGLEIQAVSTGLAGLQNTVDLTKSDVSTLEGTVAEKPSAGKIVLYVVLILLVIGGILGLVYYVEKIKHPGVNLGDAVVNYITHHIKAGRKFHHIQGDLLKAGWKQEEIRQAYHGVAKANYQNYLKGQVSTSGSNSSISQSLNQPLSLPLNSSNQSAIGSDKAKIAVIAIVSLLLISGVVFMLSTSAGQAIYLKKGILNTGEVVHQIECTPPHVLTPDGDACCLDENANTICDLTEAREAELQPTDSVSCTDNLQCSDGKSCIDKKCLGLEELYHGSSICDKQCVYYSTKILTSDGEEYYTQPGKGSYTAAGALEWKLLEMPQHCNGEDVIVPVKLIHKNQGKIISEEVITLHSGESSRVITHPQIPSVEFTLTLDEVYEICEEK